MRNLRFLVTFFVGLLITSNYLIILTNASYAKEYFPVSDSFVSSLENDVSSNYGGQNYLSISNSENMFMGIKEIYLMFKIENIDSNSIIESASLYMHTSMVSETSQIGVYYCPTDDWIEYEICWNNKPAIDGEMIDSEVVAKDNEMYKWDVTSLVDSVFPSKHFLTLVLKSENLLDSWFWFYSRDQDYSWTEDQRPMLKITYSNPPPTPLPQDENEEPSTPENQTNIMSLRDLLIIIILVGIVIASILGTVLYTKSTSDQQKNQK